MKFRCIGLMVVLNLLVVGFVTAEPDAEQALRQEARRQTEKIRQGGSTWPVHETEFFRIHHLPTTAPDPVACRELDLYLARTAERVGFSAVEIQDFRQNKITYYLCDDTTVKALTGYTTKGMADLAGRAVISSHFPHFHELVHLLVHLSFEEPPAQTLPVVQEGLACLLGGRWGRSPEVVLYTGWVHHEFGMGKLEDVLTREAYYSFAGGADVAYPIGAMLCEVVRQEAGWSGVMKLNEQVSGSLTFVSWLTAGEITDLVADVCGWEAEKRGERLKTTMAEAWPRYRRCGIEPSTLPSDFQPGLVVEKNGSSAWAGTIKNQRVWKVAADHYPIYLVSAASEDPLANSGLFREHLPDEVYRGQRYGLRCSPDEIALYDYSTNQLLATWVAGFSDEMAFFSQGDGVLVFQELDESLWRRWTAREIILP